MELIQPDGETVFQIDAGVQIHGGWARRISQTGKFSFRVAFKDAYGMRRSTIHCSATRELPTTTRSCCAAASMIRGPTAIATTPTCKTSGLAKLNATWVASAGATDLRASLSEWTLLGSLQSN